MASLSSEVFVLKTLCYQTLNVTAINFRKKSHDPVSCVGFLVSTVLVCIAGKC